MVQAGGPCDSGLLPQVSAQLQRLWEQNQRAAQGVDTIRVQLACDAEAEGDSAEEAQQRRQAASGNGPLLLQGPDDAQPAGNRAQADGGRPGSASGAGGSAAAANGGGPAAADPQLGSAAAANGGAAAEAAEAAAGDGVLVVGKDLAFMAPLIQVWLNEWRMCSCRCWVLACRPAAAGATAAGCEGLVTARAHALPLSICAWRLACRTELVAVTCIDLKSDVPHSRYNVRPPTPPIAEGGAAERLRPSRQPSRAPAQAGKLPGRPAGWPLASEERAAAC